MKIAEHTQRATTHLPSTFKLAEIYSFFPYEEGFQKGWIIYSNPKDYYIQRIPHLGRVTHKSQVGDLWKSLSVNLDDGPTKKQVTSQLFASILATTLHEMTGVRVAVIKTDITGTSIYGDRGAVKERQYDFYVGGRDLDGFNNVFETKGGIQMWEQKAREKISRNSPSGVHINIDLLGTGAGLLEMLRQIIIRPLLRLN